MSTKEKVYGPYHRESFLGGIEFTTIALGMLAEDKALSPTQRYMIKHVKNVIDEMAAEIKKGKLPHGMEQFTFHPE